MKLFCPIEAVDEDAAAGVAAAAVAAAAAVGDIGLKVHQHHQGRFKVRKGTGKPNNSTKIQ